MSQSEDYDWTKIKVLEAIDHIRHRPGMYIGGLDNYGLHRLFSGTLDNSLGGAAQGQRSRVTVTLEPGGWVGIEDDNAGFSVEPEHNGLSALEVAFTKHGQLGFHRGAFHRDVFVGGYVIASALSAELIVDSRRDGQRHRLVVERGRRVGPVRRLDSCQTEGLSLRFRLDPRIFAEDVCLVRRRLLREFQELAALLPSLTIELVDRRYGRRRVDRFHCPGGLSELVSKVTETPLLRSPLSHSAVQPYLFGRAEGFIELDLALQFQAAPQLIIASFVNGQRMREGPSIEAAQRGLDEGLQGLARRVGLAKPAEIGCVLALALRHPEACYDMTRMALRNPEAAELIREQASGALEAWGDTAPDEVVRILGA